MKNIVVFCIVLSVLCSAVSQYIESTSPAFIWSNKNFLSGQNIQVSEVVSIKDIKNALTGSSSSVSQYFTKVNPEVIFIFVEPQMTTEDFIEAAGSRAAHNGGKFASLKNLIETSASSVVFSYVNSAEAQSAIASLGAKALFTPQQLQDALNTNWDLLSNGAVDVVVVAFDNTDYAAHDSLLSLVDSKMKTTSYAAVLTSTQNKIADFHFAYPSFNRMIMDTNNGSNNGTTGGNWPDGVVEGLIIMIPFLIILFTGICCTFNVQSNLKFEGEAKVKKNQ